MATASSSLSNMSVAGDNANGSQGLLMPKLQFRFRMDFINFGVDASAGLNLTQQVMECSRPSLSFDEITLNVYNSRMYVAGKHTWAELTCKIRDDATGTVSTAIGQQIQKQMDMVEQASAASGQDYKFQLNIEILDGGNGTSTPNVLETWELYGCWVKSANYQALSYANNEAVGIDMTIRFDNAIQAPLGSGIGTTVGRTLGSIATGIGSGS